MQAGDNVHAATGEGMSNCIMEEEEEKKSNTGVTCLRADCRLALLHVQYLLTSPESCKQAGG